MTSSLRHGLESHLQRVGTDTAGSFEIAVQASRAYLNLRGPASDPRFVDRVEAVLGQSLPLTPNTMTIDRNRVLWLGPDEWLIETGEDRVAASRDALEEALKDTHAAVNEQSGGLTALLLKGDCVEDVLAKGCTLDLHVAQFPPGRCVQTGLAKAAVILARDEAGQLTLIVRRSFADYVLLWLERAAREFGVRLSAA